MSAEADPTMDAEAPAEAPEHQRKRRKPSGGARREWPRAFYQYTPASVWELDMEPGERAAVYTNGESSACFYYPVPADGDMRRGIPLMANSDGTAAVKLLRMFCTTLANLPVRVRESELSGFLLVVHRPGEGVKTEDTVLGVFLCFSWMAPEAGAEDGAADGDPPAEEEERPAEGGLLSELSLYAERFLQFSSFDPERHVDPVFGEKREVNKGAYQVVAPHDVEHYQLSELPGEHLVGTLCAYLPGVFRTGAGAVSNQSRALWRTLLHHETALDALRCHLEMEGVVDGAHAGLQYLEHLFSQDDACMQVSFSRHDTDDYLVFPVAPANLGLRDGLLSLMMPLTWRPPSTSVGRRARYAALQPSVQGGFPVAAEATEAQVLYLLFGDLFFEGDEPPAGVVSLRRPRLRFEPWKPSEATLSREQTFFTLFKNKHGVAEDEAGMAEAIDGSLRHMRQILRDDTMPRTVEYMLCVLERFGRHLPDAAGDGAGSVCGLLWALTRESGGLGLVLPNAVGGVVATVPVFKEGHPYNFVMYGKAACGKSKTLELIERFYKMIDSVQGASSDGTLTAVGMTARSDVYLGALHCQNELDSEICTSDGKGPGRPGRGRASLTKDAYREAFLKWLMDEVMTRHRQSRTASGSFGNERVGGTRAANVFIANTNKSPEQVDSAARSRIKEVHYYEGKLETSQIKQRVQQWPMAAPRFLGASAVVQAARMANLLCEWGYLCPPVDPFEGCYDHFEALLMEHGALVSSPVTKDHRHFTRIHKQVVHGYALCDAVAAAVCELHAEAGTFFSRFSFNLLKSAATLMARVKRVWRVDGRHLVWEMSTYRDLYFGGAVLDVLCGIRLKQEELSATRGYVAIGSFMPLTLTDANLAVVTALTEQASGRRYAKHQIESALELAKNGSVLPMSADKEAALLLDMDNWYVHERALRYAYTEVERLVVHALLSAQYKFACAVEAPGSSGACQWVSTLSDLAERGLFSGSSPVAAVGAVVTVCVTTMAAYKPVDGGARLGVYACSRAVDRALAGVERVPAGRGRFDLPWAEAVALAGRLEERMRAGLVHGSCVTMSPKAGSDTGALAEALEGAVVRYEPAYAEARLGRLWVHEWPVAWRDGVFSLPLRVLEEQVASLGAPPLRERDVRRAVSTLARLNGVEARVEGGEVVLQSWRAFGQLQAAEQGPMGAMLRCTQGLTRAAGELELAITRPDNECVRVWYDPVEGHDALRAGGVAGEMRWVTLHEY